MVGWLEQLAETSAPDLHLPPVFAGHRLHEDTGCDLIYVLGLLVESGVDSVAGVDLRGRVTTIIDGLDPTRVEGFSSYRLGETVARLGGLASFPTGQHEAIRTGVDSPNVRRQLTEGGPIPPNFAIVAARCLQSAADLDGVDTGSDLERFRERAREMFAGADRGWIDDGFGELTHYDIYTPDMYLFAEPLASALGPRWADGLRRVLVDIDDLAQPGGAIVWGRSIGALGMAMTIELAAIAIGHGLTDAPDRWLARADETFGTLAEWFPDGVIAAHQGRATMFYRGTPRRLQMTFDLFGKFLLAARELRRRPDQATASATEAWPPVDRFIDFTADGTATGVWTYRSADLTMALPLVHGWASDYLPSPRCAGVFEQPTSGHPVMLPVLHQGGYDERSGQIEQPLVPAGLPTRIEHAPGALTVGHSGWAPVGKGTDAVVVQGDRTATYRVEGPDLVVTESLRFAAVPRDPITITVPEPAGASLAVTVDEPHKLLSIATDGLAEWRSFWGEAARVHQIEVVPATEIDLTWRVRTGPAV